MEETTMLSWLEEGRNGGGGYRKDRPPEDDCCPICFDDFHVPCRTNCGHWFCGSCLLRLSRFNANFNLFICPVCQSWVYNLVPHSPVLIQPGREEIDEILGEIEQFNRVHELVAGSLMESIFYTFLEAWVRNMIQLYALSPPDLNLGRLVMYPHFFSALSPEWRQQEQTLPALSDLNPHSTWCSNSQGQRKIYNPTSTSLTQVEEEVDIGIKEQVEVAEDLEREAIKSYANCVRNQGT
ncbi:uncharacterized protein LOC121763582 [Salvia splendens]|uniref:uncharacterized protein LOC121763582 n=1 Tax=Salvia splendens TaxID=180675 RepID=UPI001C26A797|nr:uncharacterized protein LOC121763582 [Salvia splendens]